MFAPPRPSTLYINVLAGLRGVPEAHSVVFGLQRRPQSIAPDPTASKGKHPHGRTRGPPGVAGAPRATESGQSTGPRGLPGRPTGEAARRPGNPWAWDLSFSTRKFVRWI
jgi:hypothetical protein